MTLEFKEPDIVFNRNSEDNADFTLVACSGQRRCEWRANNLNPHFSGILKSLRK